MLQHNETRVDMLKHNLPVYVSPNLTHELKK